MKYTITTLIAIVGITFISAMLLFYTIYTKRCYGYRKFPSLATLLVSKSKNVGFHKVPTSFLRISLRSQNSIFTIPQKDFSTLISLSKTYQTFPQWTNFSTNVNLFYDQKLFTHIWISFSIEDPFHACEYFPRTRNISTDVKVFFEWKRPKLLSP